MSAARFSLALRPWGLQQIGVHTLYIKKGQRPCVCPDERGIRAARFQGPPDSKAVRILPAKHLDNLSHGSLHSWRSP